jgi:hypothetical protein
MKVVALHATESRGVASIHWARHLAAYSMTLLYEDAWAVVTWDAADDVVRYTRTALPYTTGSEMAASYAKIGDTMRAASGTRLLIDVRLAPPRNDETFEARTAAGVEALVERFPKMATLVRTAVGRLQAGRMAKERGATAHVFDSEADALAFLRG